MEQRPIKLIKKLDELYVKEKGLINSINRLTIMLRQVKDEIDMAETLLIFYQRTTLRKDEYNDAERFN